MQCWFITIRHIFRSVLETYILEAKWSDYIKHGQYNILQICERQTAPIKKHSWSPVASLGLVSHGAATDGVTPIFSSENWRPFCSSLSLFYFTRVSPLYGVIPLDGVTPDIFTGPTSFTTVLCKFSHNFFIRVSPLEGVIRGGPPSDDTAGQSIWCRKVRTDFAVFTPLNLWRDKQNVSVNFSCQIYKQFL